MKAGRQRALVVLLVALFSVPVAVAFILRLTGWSPGAAGNHGELVQPPVLLEIGAADALTDRWVLVFAPARPCDAPCRVTLDDLRRIRVGLNQNAHRIELATARPVADAAAFADVSSRAWLERLARAEPSGLRANAAYLVDPRGYYMMRYPPGFRASGMQDDLERLLRYSRVGVQ